MKVNETVPVTIAGQTVTNATVKEVGEGTVTLLVPATLVVMATRTEITPGPEPEGGSTEILGIEEASEGESNNDANTDASADASADASVDASAEVAGTDKVENPEGKEAPVEND